MKRICRDCGRVINTDNDNYILYGDEYVCEDCAEHYVECADCGEIIHIDDAYDTVNGLVCEDCRGEYVECEECGDVIRTDDCTWTENGWVCEYCADHYYSYCEQCGSYVSNENYNDDYELCRWCAERSIIHPYHYCKTLDTKFFKSCLEKIGLQSEPRYYFGIEWELVGCGIYDHAENLKKILGDRINFEEDCTVDAEGVFMPHSYDAIIESGEIKKAFEYAKDNLCDDASCAGLHVHISRTAFGETEEEQDENIAKLALLHTRGFAYDQLYKLSRRSDDEWCRPLRRHETKAESEDYAKRFVKEKYNDHNIALNCGNRATVEFRLGAGTVDYDNFINWIKIIRLLVEKCPTISMEDATNFYAWFEDADDSLKEYMESRGVKWEKAIKVTTEDYRNMMTILMDKINADLRGQGACTMDYNTMLALLCNANTQQRVALGYM